MGIFGNTSPFDQDVEKATSENNTSEEWGLILEICDRAAASTQAAKDCLRSVLRRLSHADPHVAVQAATLLDACINNCGRTFHLEVASRDFEGEFRRILSRAQPAVQRRLRSVLRRWAEGEFRSDPQLDLIPALCAKLRQEGHEFPDAPESTGKRATSSAASNAPSGAAAREQEELARAIALSLQDAKQTPVTGASLYPSVDAVTTGGGAAATGLTGSAGGTAQPVRALYDFEAAEDNELTFLAGEIIHVTDSSDPNWWKGYNKLGEGLFPANFVTTDLQPPKSDVRTGKSVQFAEDLDSTEEVPVEAETEVRIDEAAMDAALAALHDADPEDPTADTPIMRSLESAVYAMGPLIDAALQRADRRHATLTQLSADLVDALNLYHSLMREPLKPGGPHALHPQLPAPHPQMPPQMFPSSAAYFPTNVAPHPGPAMSHPGPPMPHAGPPMAHSGPPMSHTVSSVPHVSQPGVPHTGQQHHY